MTGEPVKGFEQSHSRGYSRASTKTYPKHPELRQADYDMVLSLLADELYVRRTLGRGAMDALIAEADNQGFRMPRWRANRLRMAYRRIALRFHIGHWE